MNNLTPAEDRKRTEWVWALSYLVLVAALVSLAIYTRLADQADRECINRVVASNVLTTENRLEAATTHDAAELERLTAEASLVAAMLPENSGMDPTPAARALLLALDRLLVELNDVIATRKANPVPRFEDFCRETADPTPTPTDQR